MAELAVKSKQSFEALYDEYYDKVYVYIFYRVRSRQDAEDLTSDVFMSAFVNPYDPRLAKFSTYIFTIAGNALKNYYRKAAQSGATSIDARDCDIADNTDLLGECITNEEYCALKAALAALPQRQYNVVYRRYYLGEGFREIGEALGVSENNARQHHFAAIKNLGKVLRGT